MPPKKTDEDKKEVAVREDNGALAEMDDEMRAELADLQQDFADEINVKDDVRLPALMLVQATNIPEDVEGARPGVFMHTGNSDVAKEVEIVVCRLVKTRTRFGKELGQPPLCSSPDAKNGYGDPGDDLEVRGPNGGGACHACPESAIGASCKIQFNYVSVVIGMDGEEVPWQHALPVTVTMKSTSVKTAQRLNALLMEAEFLPEFSIILSSQQEENEHGKYYIFKMRRGRKTPADVVKKAIGISKEMRKAQQQQRGLSPQEGPAQPQSNKDDADIPF